MWCLCESSTGYCLGFDVYTGNDKDAPAATMTHDLGYRVVMKLMQNHLNKHHHIYADFFTTVTLVKDLLANGMYLCGTTRAHRREYPKIVGESEAATRRVDEVDQWRWRHTDEVAGPP